MNEYMIETRGLTKQYGSQTAVHKLDLHVPPGHIYGLLGRNGAGKTTTMKMLLGLIRPTEGDVFLFGRPLAGQKKALLPRVGCLIESPGFYPNLTATENLELFAGLRGVARPDAVARTLQLVGLPYRDKKLCREYSMGMKQRLGLALALLHDPELLILDEPINGLDPIGIAEVRSFLRRLRDEQGKTILLSSHILSEISQLADDVGILDHGVLLEEASMAALEAKNRRYIELAVPDAGQAARLLESQLLVRDFEVLDDRTLRIYDLTLPMDRLNRVLFDNGLTILDLHRCEDTLEDHFKQITGGEGIG